MHTLPMTANRTYIRSLHGGFGSSGSGRGARVFDDEVSPPAAAAVHTLLGELSAAYERGWQPADVLHLARRSKEPADAPLAAALVLHEAERTRAQDRAPHDWLDQLRSIAEQYPAASDLAQRISDRVGDARDDMSDDAGVRALAAGLLFEDPYHSVYQLTDLSLAWTDLPGWTVLTPRRPPGPAFGSRSPGRSRAGTPRPTPRYSTGFGDFSPRQRPPTSPRKPKFSLRRPRS